MIKNRILITGATGGLGLALVKTFAEAGFSVTATGRSTEHCARFESCNVNFIKADLTHPGAIENLCIDQDSIIHAAALSASWGKPQHFYEINVTVTKRLLEIAKARGCRRFLYISSPSIYASMQDQYNLTENSPVAPYPLNHYARTKLLAEQLVLSKDEPDFKTLAIRPRAIVGPDDKVLLPKIIELIKGGVLPVFRDGRALVEPTDVRDVARASLLAMETIDTLYGCPINISGRRAISVKELAEKISAVMGYSPHYKNVPMPVATILAWVLEINGIMRQYVQEPKLTRYTLATLAYSQTFDLTFAKEKLGFVPEHDAISTIIDCARRSVA